MAPPPQTTALTDDLLEEIFLRIASPTDLAHVSTACVSFRRLIADSTFLRRYRSLHPPLLLGFLDPGRRFRPAEAPHPNARAARALACAADFSFDYLPRGRSWWCPQDVRDGRVLLCGRPDEDAVFMDLVVCDPVSRRVCCVSKMVALVFSSASGHWDVGTSTSWNAENPSALSVTEGMFLGWPSYAYGCFFWKVISSSKLLKLDINRMKFSIVDLPPDHVDRNVIIVETGEGRLGMFTNWHPYTL
nr:unnamed protein product [Digitaria exilis]